MSLHFFDRRIFDYYKNNYQTSHDELNQLLKDINCYDYFDCENPFEFNKYLRQHVQNNVYPFSLYEDESLSLLDDEDIIFPENKTYSRDQCNHLLNLTIKVNNNLKFMYKKIRELYEYNFSNKQYNVILFNLSKPIMVKQISLKSKCQTYSCSIQSIKLNYNSVIESGYLHKQITNIDDKKSLYKLLHIDFLKYYLPQEIVCLIMDYMGLNDKSISMNPKSIIEMIQIDNYHQCYHHDKCPYVIEIGDKSCRHTDIIKFDLQVNENNFKLSPDNRGSGEIKIHSNFTYNCNNNCNYFKVNESFTDCNGSKFFDYKEKLDILVYSSRFNCDFDLPELEEKIHQIHKYKFQH